MTTNPEPAQPEDAEPEDARPKNIRPKNTRSKNTQSKNTSPGETNPAVPPLHIWVDADACPAAIKEILYKTVRRLKIKITLVANQSMHIPKSELINLITVPDGPDVADDRIVELLNPGDVVVTGDIPLAARVVEKSATAIGVRGELYDDNSIHDRLASRDLMEEFRSAGLETNGPKPHSGKDKQTFANLLDKILTKSLRKRAQKK